MADIVNLEQAISNLKLDAIKLKNNFETLFDINEKVRAGLALDCVQEAISQLCEARAYLSGDDKEMVADIVADLTSRSGGEFSGF